MQAGRIDTARAAWWGFDPQDATQSLQAALDSRAKKVIIEQMGRPWIVTTIELPDDKEILLEPGVVIEAKRHEFRGKGACLFITRGKKYLTLRSAGATLLMHKDDYHRPPYELAEWRHALSIRGCEDVTIEGITLRESGGDGIYLGVGSENATNRDITIRNVICDGNNRQGISVITAENLLIEGCVLRQTRGTAPQAGIDFEPNRPEERLVNCVLRNCRSEYNAGHAYHIYLGFMHHGLTPVSIRFEGCTSKECGRYSTYVGVANRDGKPTVRGSIEYTGCRFEADVDGGIYVRGNESEGCRVRFERCDIVRREREAKLPAPMVIERLRQPDVDAGNIEIVDCRIQDLITRQPIALIASPLSRLRNCSGNLTYESPAGTESFRLDTKQLAAWFPQQHLADRIRPFAFTWQEVRPVETDPAGADSSPPEENTSFRLRHDVTLLVWGRAGRDVELVASIQPVGRTAPSAGQMNVKTPNGETTRLRSQCSGNDIQFTFTPQTTGPHRMEWQSESNTTLRPLRCSAPMIVFAHHWASTCFVPPAGSISPFPLASSNLPCRSLESARPRRSRPRCADSSGNIVDVQDNIALPHVFLLQRSAPTRPKSGPLVWRKPPKASWKMCPSRHSGSRPFLPCRRDMSLRFPAENPSRA